MTRLYGVDVSSFQPVNLGQYAQAGAKFAIVKLSEGLSYRNPNAAGQINSAKASGMIVAGYFFATFSNNATAANYQAQYAVANAKQLGLAKGSYLAIDWETGDGNVVTGSTNLNTQALVSAMAVIKLAGYQPLLYAGAYDLSAHIDRTTILRTFPNSLWVASYPYRGQVSQAPMNYFPNMDGIAIWQFTDNWWGLHVDGNISVLPLNNHEESEDEEISWHPEVKLNELGQFKVNRQNGAPVYVDSKLTKANGSRKYGEAFKISRAAGGAVQAGTGQWFSQADGLTKINPLTINANARAICRVATNDCWTQNKPAAGEQGITKLAKDTRYKVFGRVGKFLLVGNSKVGKYIDGDKCLIDL